MKLIKGYRHLEMAFPPSPTPTGNGNETLTALHSIYLKEHFEHANPQNQGKVLFVGNVDYFPMMNYEDIEKFLKVLFDRFGTIESISISEPDAKNSRFAHVLFDKKSVLKYILNTMTDQEYISIISNEVLPYLQTVRPKNVVESGSLPIIRQNIRELFPLYDVNLEDFQREVNEFMLEYDSTERQELFERKESKNQADEEGFVTVVSRSKRKHDETLRSTATTASSAATGNKRAHKKKKIGELKNFYQFQIKEEKMKQLDIMRRKFDENKSKIQKMKELRKFNPF
jgi:hypothetical protein